LLFDLLVYYYFSRVSRAHLETNSLSSWFMTFVLESGIQESCVWLVFVCHGLFRLVRVINLLFNTIAYELLR